MKKFTYFLLILTFLAMSQGVRAEFIPFIEGATPDTEPVLTYSESETGICIQLDIPGVTVVTKEIEDVLYKEFSVKTFGVSGSIGMPSIPFKGVYLEVPVGVDLSIDNLFTEPVEISGINRVYPCQSHLMNDQQPEFKIDQTTYEQNTFLPEDIVSVKKDGLMRGRRVVFIPIKCMQANAALLQVRGFSRISFDLTYSGNPDPAAIINQQRLQSSYFQSVQRGVILNYADLQQSNSTDPVDGCEYLFLAHESFQDVLQPLVQWKNLKGFITKVIYLNDGNCNNPGEIKSLIQAEYSKNPAPSFVCICGNTNFVETYEKEALFNEPYRYGSDYDYSLLGSGDHYPDVSLGRILVESPEKFASFVSKLMKYERYATQSDSYFSDWMFTGAFIDYQGPDDKEDYWSTETTLHFYEDTLAHSRAESSFAIFQDCETPDPDMEASNNGDSYPHRPDNIPDLAQYSESINHDISVSINELVDGLNNGLGLVAYSGHGQANSWCTDSRAFPSTTGTPIPVATEFFSSSQVSDLQETNKTPVVLSFCCLSGFFLDAGRNLSQSFLSRENAGASAVIAASHNSLAEGQTALLSRGIYDGFFPNYDSDYNHTAYKSSMRISDALNHGKLYLTNYFDNGDDEHYMRHLYHLFGDPEMMLRTTTPKPPEINLPTYIEPGTTSLNFTSPENGAQIGISQAGNLIGSGHVENGTAVIDLWEPVQAEIDVLIVVTGYNLATLEQVLSTNPQMAQNLGTIEFDSSQYSLSDLAEIMVVDPDMNQNDEAVESVWVTVSSSQGVNSSVELTETEPNSGFFLVNLRIVDHEPGLGEFQVTCGGTIQALYHDSTFNPETDVTATAEMVCKPRVMFGGLLDSYLIVDDDQMCGRVNALMCVEKNGNTVAQAGLTELPADPWQEPVFIWDMYESLSDENYYIRNETFEVELPQSGGGNHTFGMAVTDGGENYSHHWPFMPVKPNPGSNGIAHNPTWYENLVQVPNAAPSTETLQMYQKTIQHLQATNAGPGEKPIIWAAGYLDSDLRAGEPGILKIGAVVTQDQYGHSIDRIDVIDYQGRSQYSLNGPGTFVDGFYWFYGEWTINEMANLTGQESFFRMRIVNSDDSMGDYWPHFIKYDASEVAPENLIAEVSDSSITLNWSLDNSIEIDHFTVSWVNSETNQTEDSENLGYDVTSYDIIGLSNCVTYNLYVTAHNLCSNNEGGYISEIISAVPSMQPIPQNFKIDSNQENQFVISWAPTSSGIYALYEGYSNSTEDLTFLSFHSTCIVPQPEIGDYAKFFAVRSCISNKQSDLEFASCFSEVVRGLKIPNGAGIVQKLTVIDVNNDGIEDLVLISEDSRLKFYLGQPDGSWVLSDQSFPSTVKDYTLFDFNKDGSVDLAVAAPNEVKTYFNDGTGSMNVTESLFPPGHNEVIASDDLDNKGTSDVLVGNTSGTLVKVNDADGQTEEVQYLDSGDTKVLVAEDFDGDGKKDLITATETGENVIWKKDETGLFVDTNQDIFTWGTEAIEAHDVNNDGCIDLVVTDSDGQTVTFINDCTGNFTVQ